MPLLIEYLDRIAREKQRDVLCISFYDSAMKLSKLRKINFETQPQYMQVTAWLDANNILWQRCGLQSDVLKHGRIYVDVPFDTADPVYQKLADYLEYPDGSMKIAGVKFYYMPLADAMKFAEQDEPGYWEKEWEDD